jgi:hypothetical protein
VFLAREPAPYRLAWGHVPDKPNAIALEQLIPTRKFTDPLPADAATIAPPVAAVAAPPSVPASAASPAAVSTASSKPWLWAALLAGVALMGFMAWSLLRGHDAAPKDSRPT